MVLDEDAIVAGFVGHIDRIAPVGLGSATCGGGAALAMTGVRLASLVPCFYADTGGSEDAIMFDKRTSRASGGSVFSSPDASSQTGKTRRGDLLSQEIPAEQRAKYTKDDRASKARATATVVGTASGKWLSINKRLDGHSERPQQAMKVMSYETVVAE